MKIQKKTPSEILIEHIIPDPNQPRKNFDKGKLRELADSIEKHGLLQPILVRPLQNGKFQIVHGERRFRACKLLGFKKIRAEIRNLTDKEALEIQLVENIQREDINPIEEAEAYARLIKEFGYTHQEIARKIAKTREYVTNKLRLLKLPSEIQNEIRKGNITESHGRLLLSLNESDKQKQLAERVIDDKLTVRETEQLVNSLKGCIDVTRVTSITPPPEAKIESQDIPKDGLVIGIWISPKTYDALTQLANSKQTTVERLCSELIERSLTK